MRFREHRCLVCTRQGELHGVVVDGRQILLCSDHYRALGEDAEGPFADLASLMAHPGLERRQVEDRRRRERRMFPRPEGRRRGMGRRAEDPRL